jgi:Flp pilus assembly pilin Flp
MVDRINSLFVSAWVTAREGFRREEGQALTEYALVLAVVVIGIVAAMGVLVGGIGDKIQAVVDSIAGAAPSAG